MNKQLIVILFILFGGGGGWSLMKSWDKEWCLLSYIKIPVASLQITACCWQRASPFTVKQPWWSVSSPKIRPPRNRKVNWEYNAVCSFHGRSNIQGSGTGPTRRGKPASRTPAGMDGQKWYVFKKKWYFLCLSVCSSLERKKKTGQEHLHMQNSCVRACVQGDVCYILVNRKTGLFKVV